MAEGDLELVDDGEGDRGDDQVGRDVDAGIGQEEPCG